MLSQFGLTRVLPPSSLLLLRLRLSVLLCSCRLGSDRGCVSVRCVVCCLVRTALSWSSPVDLASLAWLLRDEQSSYDDVRESKNERARNIDAAMSKQKKAQRRAKAAHAAAMPLRRISVERARRSTVKAVLRQIRPSATLVNSTGLIIS